MELNPSIIMLNLRELKKRADGAFVELFRSLFEEIDTTKLKAEIEALRASSENFDPLEQSIILTRRTAIRCAATGAVSGLPSGAIAIGTLGADLAYLVYQQFRLILGIATIYGHEPSQRDRFNEALTCLAYGSGVGFGKGGISAVLEVAVLEGGILAEQIGVRFLRDRLSKVIPVLGVVSAGALNYVAVRAVGRATIRYYESKIDPALADAIWADGDREHA